MTTTNQREIKFNLLHLAFKIVNEYGRGENCTGNVSPLGGHTFNCPCHQTPEKPTNSQGVCEHEYPLPTGSIWQKIDIEVEKAHRRFEHRKFKGRVHAEALRVWASIATKKEKEQFKKMFKAALTKSNEEEK